MRISFFPSLCLLLVLYEAVSSISLRCQCTKNTEEATCYNGWCEVHHLRSEQPACALEFLNGKPLYSCVRVPAERADGCKLVDGVKQCICRDEDYCNVDLDVRAKRDASEDETEKEETCDKDNENADL